ncbi:MAG: SUMF1/EgtB/PvdO family nonheme iron enzyme [bacterium]|nr:SUMF1/EgtB/PvdO family nonheme iron enzyme [bacterium]
MRRINYLLLAIFCVPLVGFLQSFLSAAELPTGERYVNSLGMEFVRIEPGTFLMGCGTEAQLPEEIVNAKELGGRTIWLPPKGDYDEHPTHEVAITGPFYMGVCEVTNRQYEEFDRLHAHLRGKNGFSIDSDEAVIFVSWHEARAFCDWLSEKEGLPYRLPTEAEWEYACRAGTTTPFSTGDTLPKEFLKNPDNSWYPALPSSRGRQEVVPLHVRKTSPNPWGLYDMHGNVEEWCQDWYGPYPDEKQSDPVGLVDGDFRICRGGSHGTVAFYLRSANRLGTLPEDKSWFIGFRVAIGNMPDTPPLFPPPKPLYQQNVRQEVPQDILKGPDPAKPYFRGPRNYVKIPASSYGPLYDAHNHDPAITECPNGDLLAIWYTTVTERGRELSVAASRLRYGEDEWEPASLCWDAPDRNDHAPALWFNDDKTIYHVNALSTAATWGPLAIVLRTSTDSGATWSRARLIVPEHQSRNQVAESVFRTREGYFVFAADATPAGDGGTALHISRDGGVTWQDAGGTIAGIHAGVAQVDDGRLIAFGRGDEVAKGPTRFLPRGWEGEPNAPRYMPMSISDDLGKSWTYMPSIFPPIGGGQRMVLLKLREGPLFLASFANENFEGREAPPVMVTDVSGKQRRVKGLFAAVSYDGGKTWPKVRLVSDDGPPREVATTDGKAKFIMSASSAEPRGYLSVCQGRNGVIHLISSWNHYAFNLKWIETPPPAER